MISKQFRVSGSRKDREDCSRRGRKDINVVETHCLFSKQDALSTLKTLRSLRENHSCVSTPLNDHVINFFV